MTFCDMVGRSDDALLDSTKVIHKNLQEKFWVSPGQELRAIPFVATQAHAWLLALPVLRIGQAVLAVDCPAALYITSACLLYSAGATCPCAQSP